MRRVAAHFAWVWGKARSVGRVIAVTFPGHQRQLEGEDGVESFPGGRRRLKKEGVVAKRFFEG